LVSFSVVAAINSSRDQRFRAGDDFHDLLGDLGLARAVHLEREVVDDLAGVLGGVAHGGHARAVLRRRGLEERTVDRDLDVVGDEALEDLLRPGLVLDERVVSGLVVTAALVLGLVLVLLGLEDRRLLQRQQRLAAHLLHQRRDVAVVEDVDAVDLVVDVGRDEVLGDAAGVRVGRAVGEARVAARDLAAAEPERRHAAPAGGVEDHVAALVLVLGRRPQAGAQDLRVERAREAAIARDEQDRDPVLVLVLLEDRQARDLAAGRLGGLAGHAPDRAGVRAQVGDPLLGAPQARGRDHLHRPRDLADVLDGVDPLLDVALGGSHG
jgi:hypothetical protein